MGSALGLTMVPTPGCDAEPASDMSKSSTFFRLTAREAPVITPFWLSPGAYDWSGFQSARTRTFVQARTLPG